MDISDRLFQHENDEPDEAEASVAAEELKGLLRGVGAQFSTIGWDGYDGSVELYGVPPEYRLTPDAQRIIHSEGFLKAYVNHTDKWETHYNFKPREEFTEAKGWRVSYPHKRGEGEKGIWVEEIIPTWPKAWFESGYVIVK